MRPRVVVGGLEELQRTFATEFRGRAADAIARRDRFILGLSGGSVASAFLPVLATLDVDWARTEIFWIDERGVPPDDTESNYGVASRLLLVPARVPPGRVHRIPGELPDLDCAARRASDELKSIAGDPPAVDFVLAGVGEDGHVASIFPGRAAGNAKCEAQPIVAVHDSPKPPSRRLTFTLDVLGGARFVAVAAFGTSKAAVMRDAIEGGEATTPVAELLCRATASVVLLDREAGGLLRDGYSLS